MIDDAFHDVLILLSAGVRRLVSPAIIIEMRSVSSLRIASAPHGRLATSAMAHARRATNSKRFCSATKQALDLHMRRLRRNRRVRTDIAASPEFCRLDGADPAAMQML